MIKEGSKRRRAGTPSWPGRLGLLGILGAASAAWAVDLGVHKGCAATDAEFAVERIFRGPNVTNDQNSNGVLKLAFDSQGDTAVDVYFVQKQGTVRRYNGRTATVDSLGFIPADHFREQGLVGLALDPAFKRNRALYFMYSAIEAGGRDSTYRVSRFTLSPDGKRLDMASEKVMLRIRRNFATWHTGGAMEFDAYGDLWIAVGDNMRMEDGPGNTADLRGGILRIHPDENGSGRYTIPKGNFAEHFAARFRAEGKGDLAGLYADTSKVRPELYVKGTRNVYTLSVDPVRRWLAFADVGPDHRLISEEYNLISKPAFGGWPYFAGEQGISSPSRGAYGFRVPATQDPAAPLNTFAGIAGADRLPPNQDPIFARTQACAMTGPIFRYDGGAKSPHGFPPQFNRKWIISGCDNYGFHLLTLDARGEKIVERVKIFSLFTTGTLLDLKQGPDGALYYVSWHQGINRIAYRGSCRDESLRPEKTGCADPAARNYDAALPKAFHDPRLCQGPVAVRRGLEPGEAVQAIGGGLRVAARGGYEIRLLALDGRLVHRERREGGETYVLPQSLPAGVYRALVRMDHGGGHTVRVFHPGP